jgi:hypothetical protein
MLPGLAPSPKSPNAQVLRGAPHQEDVVTALFLVMTIIGIVEVASVLVMSTVHRRAGRGAMSFNLTAQATGFVAAGVGGLAMVWGDIGAAGFSIVTVGMLGALLTLIYKVAIPYTHRRWPGPPSDPAEERARPG